MRVCYISVPRTRCQANVRVRDLGVSVSVSVEEHAIVKISVSVIRKVVDVGVRVHRQTRLIAKCLCP
jgi:hypothetical protein